MIHALINTTLIKMAKSGSAGFYLLTKYLLTKQGKYSKIDTYLIH